MVALMFTLAFTVAAAQDGVVRALRTNVRHVKRVGGWMLVAVGVWVIVLAAFAERFARVFPV
jgi:cytochrome c biogenesis protein CcdA